jgi:hypothetical protein
MYLAMSLYMVFFIGLSSFGGGIIAVFVFVGFTFTFSLNNILLEMMHI